jgi:hypothetical protein
MSVVSIGPIIFLLKEGIGTVVDVWVNLDEVKASLKGTAATMHNSWKILDLIFLEQGKLISVVLVQQQRCLFVGGWNECIAYRRLTRMHHHASDHHRRI